MDSLGLYLSLEYLLCFLPNLYVPLQLGGIFKFMAFRLLENVFANENIIFTHSFHAK